MPNAAAPNGLPAASLGAPGQKLPMGGQALSWVALGAGGLAVAGIGLSAHLGLGRGFLTGAALSYGAMAGVALLGLSRHPHGRFGAANGITTLRAAITALFGGLLAEIGLYDEPAARAWPWWFAGLALVSLLLDGIDGYLARRQRLSSVFGARFDMEVDALLILLLSALAFGLGKAGPLVLAVGLMRYAFLAASWIWPWMAADLPESLRRKTICVVQGVVLGLLLLPFVEPPISQILAVATFAALAASFMIDIAWLHRRRRAAQ